MNNEKMKMLDSMSIINENFTTATPKNKPAENQAAISEQEFNEVIPDDDYILDDSEFYASNQIATQAKNTQSITTATTGQNENSASITQAEYLQSLEQNDFALFDRLRNEFNPNAHYKTEFVADRFPRGHVSIIAGAPDVGKSLTLEMLYADLSKGGKIFGGIAFESTPKKSIVITADIPEELIIERNDEFKFGIDFNYVEIIDANKYGERGFDVSLTPQDSEGNRNIYHLAQTKGLDLLIFDSLGFLYSGKENDNQQLIQVFKFLKIIARKFNIAVVVVHHIRKRLAAERKNQLTLDDLIGGSVITRYSAAVYALEYDDKYGMNVIKTLKFWYKNRPKTIGYKAYTDLYGHSHLDITLDLEKIAPQTSNPNTVIKTEWKQLLDAFLQGKGINGASIKEMNDFLNSVGQEINENTLKSEISRREKAKMIIKLKRGVYALPENEIIQNSAEKNQINFNEVSEA